MTEYDALDMAVWTAVLKIRKAHNDAQRRLNLPVTDHTDRSPFEQTAPCSAS